MAHDKIMPFVKDADLLIIESTYGEDMGHIAGKHKHLTAKQAAEIAKKASVKKLVLTHLSDRYEKNPQGILDEAKRIFKNCALAKDLDSLEI